MAGENLLSDIRLALRHSELRPVYTVASARGGMAAESQPFPPPGATRPPFRHRLQQGPAAEVLSVTGANNQVRYLFGPGVDYRLAEDRMAVEWLEGAQLPDAGTSVQITYYPAAADRPRTASARGRVLDLRTTSGAENLAQAVIMRLLTPRGELAALAHPDYGSRLHQLVGRQNTETTRNLVKLYILESLKMEPRIEKVREVAVTAAGGTPARVDVRLAVEAKGEAGTVVIGPFTLELEQ
ncbi:MAG: DUF2634 domain-containing protein [Chloroflexi bacterium]|nr:DUF2634 domain-containing protein [Chloroflexota bacterium]